MRYLGIDPGASGALVSLSDSGEHFDAYPFTGWKNAYAALSVYSTGGALCLLEKVHAMPKQGVTSSFTFGKNTGGWVSLLEGLRIPYEEITPQRWQKGVLGDIPSGESKKRALDFCRKKFPNYDFSKALSNKAQSGIVDALCMAIYIRAKNLQG